MRKAIKVSGDKALTLARQITDRYDEYFAALAEIDARYKAEVDDLNQAYKDDATRLVGQLTEEMKLPWPASQTAMDGRYLKAHGDAYVYNLSASDDAGGEPVGTLQ